MSEDHIYRSKWDKIAPAIPEETVVAALCARSKKRQNMTWPQIWTESVKRKSDREQALDVRMNNLTRELEGDHRLQDRLYRRYPQLRL